jgi:hypothetical protein
MPKNLVTVLVGAAVLAGVGVAAASVATQASAQQRRTTTTSSQRVWQAFAQLSEGPGTRYVHLLEATSHAGKLSARLAVSSITIAQMGGTQPLEVGILAANCDHSNAYGQIEDVVVAQNATVHLTYPNAIRLPFVAELPATWCLFATTAQDGANLHVSLVGNRL